MVQLTKLLRESGRYRVHVACLNGEGSLRNELERSGVNDILEYPLTSFYDRNMVSQLGRFTTYLKEHKIDVVHTHDFYSNVFGMTGAMLTRVPARVASRREIGGIRTSNQKRVERIAFRLATGIVTNAEAVRAQLVSEGVAIEKVRVVYNGLDLNRMAPLLSSRSETLAVLRLPPDVTGADRKFVTIVANMRHEVKDHPMFLRAARRVLDAVPSAAFLLAGEGKLLGSIRALARDLGIADSTFFLEGCEHVSDLLSISDVCVLSSKAEGFSNSILEYMAAARPVVATDVGGAKEAIVEGETGYLVKSGDENGMADRIIELLLNPARASSMGQKGRQVVEEKFSCAAQLKKTETIYSELLRKTREVTAARPEGSPLKDLSSGE